MSLRVSGTLENDIFTILPLSTNLIKMLKLPFWCLLITSGIYFFYLNDSKKFES